MLLMLILRALKESFTKGKSCQFRDEELAEEPYSNSDDDGDMDL